MPKPRFDLIPGTQTCGITECRYGFMIYPRHDGMVSRVLGLYGEWSQGEVDLFAQYVRPGDTVIEVGSHIGSHTVPLALMVGTTGRILAFEAQEFLFYILKSNLILNRLPQATAYLAAVSDNAGEIAVPIFDYTQDKNYGALSVRDPEIFNCEPISTSMRQTLTLDSLEAEVCRLIKIDAEGMESEVLRGASGLISRQKPILYVENDRVENSDTLRQLLSSFGYEAWWHRVPLYNPNNFAKAPIDWIDAAAHRLVSANLIAFHKTADDLRPTKLERFL
jgi:FkbM family methyltransferase